MILHGAKTYLTTSINSPLMEVKEVVIMHHSIGLENTTICLSYVLQGWKYGLPLHYEPAILRKRVWNQSMKPNLIFPRLTTLN
jgi:hypothetical protein